MSGEVACRNDECGTIAWPQMALNGKGKVAPACPKCGLEHIDVALENFQVGKPVDGDRKALPEVSVPRWDPPGPVAPRPAVPHAPIQSGPEPSAIPRAGRFVLAPAALETFDPITACRDRLTHLQGEDARLEGVIAEARSRLVGTRVEAKRLTKMLNAAARAIVDTSHHQ